MKTMNDERGSAVLAINDTLGFATQPVWIAYQKDLGPQ
jgi:hypothetical protein